MPITWTDRIWREYRARNLTRAFRDILLTLKTFRGQGGQIWPSHQTLANRARCSVSSVQRCLAHAQRLALVDWAERRVRVGWRWLRTSNVYSLIVPDTDVEPTMKPLWPRPRTNSQDDRGEDQLDNKIAVESKKALLEGMLRAAAEMPDLLALRRKAMEVRLMAMRGLSKA